jgi:hypothetical protein
VLTAHTSGSSLFPSNQGYTVGSLVAIGLLLVAALLSWVLPDRQRTAATFSADQELEIEEDVDAAISGTAALEQGLDSLERTR